MSDTSDDELVERARAGDRRAFGRLSARHYGAIHRAAWRACGNVADAEDAAQEALICIARSLSGFEGRATFRCWAIGVAVNCARDVVRARERRTRMLREAAVAALVEDAPAEQAEDPEAELWAEVRGLPDGQREAVLLVHVEGLSHREAAAALGCAEATVSWRLFAARRRLKSRLSRRAA